MKYDMLASYLKKDSYSLAPATCPPRPEKRLAREICPFGGSIPGGPEAGVTATTPRAEDITSGAFWNGHAQIQMLQSLAVEC